MLAILCFFILTRLGTKGSNKYILAMIAVQLGVCTGHMIALVIRLVRGFATTGGFLELLDLALPEHVAEEAFYFINAQIGDWFMTWRVYVVWQKNKWLPIPFLISNCALFASCIAGLVNQSKLGPTDTAYDHRIKAQFIVSLSLSLFVQSLGALLIALNAWATPMLVINERPRRSRLDPVALVCVFVDTGMAYVLATLLLLLFFVRTTVAPPIILTVMTGQISVRLPLSAPTASPSLWPSFSSDDTLTYTAQVTVPMSIVLRECWKTWHARKLRAKKHIAIPQSTIVPEQVITPVSPVGRASPFGQGTVADESVLINIMRSTQADGPTTVVLKSLGVDEERGDSKGERPRTPAIYW
ncbi:hypothetical protein OF83DRAFT_1180514 [Amylostereum chailletii]|nr:hypothetical protein OF83DRAFT_1180514 [Amylostereum chailletii]